MVRVRDIWAILGIVLALLILVSGCTSNTTDTADTTTRAPTIPSLGQTAQGTIDDGHGDTATVGVAIGAPVAASQVPEAQACTAAFTSSTGEVAIPVEITLTLHSSLPTLVAIDLGNIDGLTSDGGISIPNVEIRWSLKYSDTPQECRESGFDGAGVRWNPATPGRTNTFLSWMVLSSGVTGSDPSGTDTAGALVFNPMVTLGTYKAVPEFDRKAKQVVQCSASDPAMGMTSYIAIVPDVAVHYGCTSPTARDQIAAEHDAVCIGAFPDRSTRDVDGASVSNKAASLYQVCEGFGSSAVTFNLEMSCAIVAFMADQLPASVTEVHTVDKLCNTDSVLRDFNGGKWLQDAGQAGCSFIGGLFAKGLGIAAAGATAETGPGAVAIGLVTYHALSAGVGLLCDGGFRDAVANVGRWLEATHEAHVARDITNNPYDCLKHDPNATLKKWSVTKC